MVLEEVVDTDVKSMAKSFVGGIIFTLILVIIIPVITTVYMQPIVEKGIGDHGIAIFSSSMIISGVMLLITILFALLFGGGAILRNFGIIGVFGLIFAYWLLGNPYGAVMPVITLILIGILKWIWGKIKDKRNGKTKKKKAKGKKKKR